MSDALSRTQLRHHLDQITPNTALKVLIMNHDKARVERAEAAEKALDWIGEGHTQLFTEKTAIAKQLEAAEERVTQSHQDFRFSNGQVSLLRARVTALETALDSVVNTKASTLGEMKLAIDSAQRLLAR